GGGIKYLGPRFEVMGHGTAGNPRLLGDFLCSGLAVPDIDQTLHGGVQNMHTHQMAFLSLPTSVTRPGATRRSTDEGFCGCILAFHTSSFRLTRAGLKQFCKLPCSIDQKTNKQFFYLPAQVNFTEWPASTVMTLPLI